MGWSREWVSTATGLTWLAKVAGLLFTAIAASLGAPFWFDILSKFVAIRGAGTPPPKATIPSKPDDAPADAS